MNIFMSVIFFLALASSILLLILIILGSIDYNIDEVDNSRLKFMATFFILTSSLFGVFFIF